jgi:hypothetical protein
MATNVKIYEAKYQLDYYEYHRLRWWISDSQSQQGYSSYESPTAYMMIPYLLA